MWFCGGERMCVYVRVHMCVSTYEPIHMLHLHPPTHNPHQPVWFSHTPSPQPPTPLDDHEQPVQSPLYTGRSAAAVAPFVLHPSCSSAVVLPTLCALPELAHESRWRRRWWGENGRWWWGGRGHRWRTGRWWWHLPRQIPILLRLGGIAVGGELGRCWLYTWEVLVADVCVDENHGEKA